MIEVIPSILATTRDEFEMMVHKLESHVDRVHLDIVDGNFASNTTIKGYEELLKLETNLAFDVHLMVQKPDLEPWFATKADRFILHVESEGDKLEYLMRLEEHGKRRALAVNPATDFKKMESLLPHLDFVQFMTVNPGFYGSPFLPDVLEHIRAFHDTHPHMAIAVDGGITDQTAPQVCSAGASLLVSGSYIINSSDIAASIQKLQTQAKS